MNAEAVESLISRIQGTTGVAAKCKLIRQLGKIKPTSFVAVRQLIASMQEQDINVVLCAGHTLRRLGQEGIPHLLTILQTSGEEEEVRSFAADSIADLEGVGLPSLIDLIAADDGAVREMAIEALPRVGVGAEAAVPTLAHLICSSDLAQPTAIALARIAYLQQRPEESPAFGVLTKALNCENPVIRKEVVAAFRFLDDKIGPAVPLLTQATNDADSEVRKEASWQLRRLRAGKY